MALPSLNVLVSWLCRTRFVRVCVLFKFVMTRAVLGATSSLLTMDVTDVFVDTVAVFAVFAGFTGFAAAAESVAFDAGARLGGPIKTGGSLTGK
jgi:hypothetical protein